MLQDIYSLTLSKKELVGQWGTLSLFLIKKKNNNKKQKTKTKKKTTCIEVEDLDNLIVNLKDVGKQQIHVHIYILILIDIYWLACRYCLA